MHPENVTTSSCTDEKPVRSTRRGMAIACTQVHLSKGSMIQAARLISRCLNSGCCVRLTGFKLSGELFQSVPLAQLTFEPIALSIRTQLPKSSGVNRLRKGSHT